MANFSLYTEYGLTAQSNNPDIITRDNNGNVIIYSGNDGNQKLLIETVKERYTNRSVIDTIDTQFRYFTFPVADVGVNVTTAIPLPGIGDISSILPDAETGEPPPVRFDPNTDRISQRLIRSNIQYLFDIGELQTNKVHRLFERLNDAVNLWPEVAGTGDVGGDVGRIVEGEGYLITRNGWIYLFTKVSSGNRTEDLVAVLERTIDDLVSGGDGLL